MIFEIAGERQIANPTDADIRAVLESFTPKSAKRGEAFVVLSSSDLTYMQCSGEKVQGFDLEYQEGSTDAHFRARRNDFTLDEIVSRLIAYRDGKPDWKSAVEWERLEL